MNPPTYPARPTNGGALGSALPKIGEWSFEPKYDGWRALIHVPTGAMFNRQLQRLSVQYQFGPAVNAMRSALDAEAFEWVDAEVLLRRSNVRGTIIVFDLIPKSGWHPTYLQRHTWLKAVLEVHQPDQKPADNSLLLAPSCPSWECASSLYRSFRSLNDNFGVKLYEGIVAKRSDKPYPIQLRGPEVRTPYWIKHRFDQQIATSK
jgi:ATP-dependent DNA ligase